MARRLPVSAIQARQRYVRAGGADLLREGAYADGTYGWVTDVGGRGNVRWGDWPSVGAPSWWLGEDDYGAVVEGQAIGPNGPWRNPAHSILSAVTRCTEVIMGPLVGTEWTHEGPGGLADDLPLWITDPMLLGSVPGPVSSLTPAGLRLDAHSFWTTWATHALWWGLGAFVCVEGADGQPVAGSLRLLNPYLVGVDDTGHLVIDPRGQTPVRTNWDGRFILGGKVWRLVTLRGLGPNDGRTPEGVLTRHYSTLRLGASVSEYVAGTFSSGVPAGFLKVSAPNFEQDEADDLRSRWLEAHGGSRRSIAVLSSTVDFQPISLSPVDAAVAEVQGRVLAEVAHAFNLSAVWLDQGASGLTYTNTTERRRDLVDVSLAGWATRLESVLSALLPYGHALRVNWSAFHRPSPEVIVPALVAAVQAGILTGMEARQYLGLIPGHRPDPAWTDRTPAVTEPTPPPAPAPTPALEVAP
jgi:HK97 family phage portal protein